jgi:hypothetical protein
LLWRVIFFRFENQDEIEDSKEATKQAGIDAMLAFL